MGRVDRLRHMAEQRVNGRQKQRVSWSPEEVGAENPLVGERESLPAGQVPTEGVVGFEVGWNQKRRAKKDTNPHQEAKPQCRPEEPMVSLRAVPY